MKITKFISFMLVTVTLISCGGKKQTTSESEENEQNVVSEEVQAVEDVKPAIPQGALTGLFSISASKQVRFSQGNLQYLPATKKWQFAKNQYDYIGLSNGDISADYDGWIDLFGWGTSGWNNGGNAFSPVSTGSTPMSYGEYYYGPRGENGYNNDLTGKYAKADWGVYNAIANGGDQPNQWRTLTAQEWEYLLFKRPNAMQLLALGTVGGVNGLFIMPDDYEEEDLFSTLADRDYAYVTESYGTKGFYCKYNGYWSSFQRNEMKELEKRGIVFLPAAGWRIAKSAGGINENGHYWTATRGTKFWNYSENHSYCAAIINITGELVSIYYGQDRDRGSSVRLVQDVVE